MKQLKKYLKLISLPAIFASLCCLSPLVLVLIGLSTVTVAASFAESFYYAYRGYFWFIAAVLLVFSIIIYFRGKGVCTLDQAKRNRNEIVNTTLIAAILTLALYLGLTYGPIYWVGKAIGIWK